MVSLGDILPAPRNSGPSNSSGPSGGGSGGSSSLSSMGHVWNFDRLDPAEREAERRKKETRVMLPGRKGRPPPYGQRKGWIPRTVNDYGDGGAFPEIHVAQYPLDMGRAKTTSNALALQVDETGKVRYDAIARHGARKDKVIYSRPQDLYPLEAPHGEEDPEFQRPDEEEIAETTEKTRQALEQLVSAKIQAAMPVKRAEKLAPKQYIRYTPSNQGKQFNSGASQRIITMVEAQEDPMEPPKFQCNKKIPRGPPSPPPPVLHEPSKRATEKQQKEWMIPPCVSNWKNSKGYTIPLDKRLAADGRGLQQVHINENFSKLAEALYIADRKAREAVETRAQLEKKLLEKEKAKKEERLRELAAKARDARAGITTAPAAPETTAAAEQKERDQIRAERHRDRQRDKNIQRAAPERRSKLEKQRDRDISEQIALGLPSKSKNDDTQFDSRLFNQSKGLDSGYGLEDDTYNVYDKPWRSAAQVGASIYRPTKGAAGGAQDQDLYGENLDSLLKGKRFVADKEFSGTDHSQRRDGPVQFEKDGAGGPGGGGAGGGGAGAAMAAADDPFGLDKLDRFLTEAKKASKRPADGDHGERKKRRD